MLALMCLTRTLAHQMLTAIDTKVTVYITHMVCKKITRHVFFYGVFLCSKCHFLKDNTC